MSEYNEQRAAFDKAVKTFDGNNSFAAARALLLSGEKTVSFNRKIIEKNIDSSWLTEIEKALPHLDTVIRNPRNTIKEVEEIVPIAMSRKITVESIKHLGQHTDLIQDIDKKTGKITPSKILNIHKEETLDTYENRFVNTLIDRLYIFINIRYNKLVQTAEAQEAYSFNYDTMADSGDGRKVNISFKIETVDSLAGGSKDTDVWARLERVKKAIEGYKGSVLCTTLGNAFIRPPVMRTNAITKNVDLMACLTLWQFIESYDKAGYEVNVSDTAQRPDDSYIEDIYGLTAMNYMLFRSYTHGTDKSEELKTIKSKTLAPKVVRRFDKQTSDKYDVIVINFANPDMVGHTGVIPAAVKAVEKVDELVGKAVQAVKDVDGVLFICADHGNAEKMIDYETGAPHTAHTTNPVPFILVNYDDSYTLRDGGSLCDIAPTLIQIMGLNQPAEMTGKSLLIKK